MREGGKVVVEVGENINNDIVVTIDMKRTRRKSVEGL